MNIFLFGRNQEVLASLIRTRTPYTFVITSDFSRVDTLISNICLHKQSCLLIVDANDPIDHFGTQIPLIISRQPWIECWAILETPSKAIKSEMDRLGFSRILSYRDYLIHEIDAFFLNP